MQHKAVWAGPDVRISGTTGNRLWNNVLEASAGKKEEGGWKGGWRASPFFFKSHDAKSKREWAD